jgi:hypothetical protein
VTFNQSVLANALSISEGLMRAAMERANGYSEKGAGTGGGKSRTAECVEKDVIF